MFKRKCKKAFLFILTCTIMLSVVFTALAAVYPDINADTTRIASIANTTADGYECDGMGGLSVTATGSNNRLFVLKADDADKRAVLYMFEDYTTMKNNENSGKYGKFILKDFVGHANGMAIDDDYIYITCWKNDENNTNGKKVARISRKTLWSKYKSTSSVNKGTLTADSGGCTILPVVYSDGSAYNESVKSITYYKNGKFIIGYPVDKNSEFFEGITIDQNKDYLTYTTAQVSDGKFVVSKSKSDVFHVSFNHKNTVGQDIGYDADCGFFIIRYFKEKEKNSIIWIKLNSLSGENRLYESDNSKYRIIKVNKSSSIFETYELEAVSIGSDNCMYASVNTRVTSDEYSQYSKDAIIKIERPTAVSGSKNFLGKYFGQ